MFNMKQSVAQKVSMSSLQDDVDGTKKHVLSSNMVRQALYRPSLSLEK